MRLLLNVILLGIAILLAYAIAWLLGLGTQTSLYATHADAAADGAIGRGWVPEFVPGDATDILEVHNVENAFVSVSFRAPGAPGDWGFLPVAAAYRAEALQRIRSVRFPGARPGRRASVTYRCEQDGVGLLAHERHDRQYFYAGPFEGASLRGLCATRGREGP